MSDRPSQRPYNVTYYRRNRDREIERVTRRQQATLQYLRDLRRVPCRDCGGTFKPHQMDFDHRDPSTKLFNVTGSRAMLVARDRLDAELAKCEIVCANCHAVRTYALQSRLWAERRASDGRLRSPLSIARTQRSARKREFLFALRDQPCHDCHRRFPPFVMQFDHRNATDKAFNVAQSSTRAAEAVLKEAAKCDIVCRSCHRDRTFRRHAEQAGVA
jgi:hypothetical protein